MKLLLFIVIGALFCATVKSSEPSPLIHELMKGKVFNMAVGLQCLVDVVSKVSKENGLSNSWLASEPVIKNHMAKWLKCPDAGNKKAVLLCNLREGTVVTLILQKYLQSVATQFPHVFLLIVIEYSKSCPKAESIDTFLSQITNEEVIAFNDIFIGA